MDFETKAALDELKRRIVDKLSQGPSDAWRVTQFNYASEEISSITNEYVSAITLKRIFGKIDTKQNYLPQISTLNILAKYLGFRDYIEFVKSFRPDQDQNNELVKKIIQQQIQEPITDANFNARRFGYKVAIFTVAIIILLACYLFIYLPFNNQTLEKNYEFEIIGNKVDSQWVEVTYVVDFSKYPLGKLNQIYFNDGKFELLPKLNRAIVKHKYARREIEIYKAIVIIDSKNVKSLSFVPAESQPIVEVHEYSKNNVRFSKKHFYSKGVDTLNGINNHTGNPISDWLNYINISPNFNIHSNNFYFECNAFRQLTDYEQEKCFDAVFTLYFEEDQYILRFRDQGCFFKAFPEIKIGSHIIKRDNPDYLKFRFKNPEILNIRVSKIQNRLQIISDGETVVSLNDMPNLGKFLGIKFMTKGADKIIFNKFVVSDNAGAVLFDYRTLEQKFKVAN